MKKLAQSLGHVFANARLLTRALTHPSHSADNNQRLEFLGDAVLELTVSHALFEAHPNQPEGRLTRMRAAIVCEERLDACACELKLGQYLIMSPGEERSGGREKPSILADALEAVIAAVYLDGGFDAAKACVWRLLNEDIHNPLVDEVADAKTHLQEFVQAQGHESPIYRDARESGPDHAKEFLAEVLINGQPRGSGAGRTKKAAQQAAAQDALNKLQERHV